MGKRILIIEDDIVIAELERDYLEASGFEADIASDGGDGLACALKNDYSLILLDLMLPEMDGFEVCRHIREVKNIPILIVSARKDDICKIKIFDLGGDDYIIKPFSPSELVARVKGHIARYESLVYGDKRRHNVSLAFGNLIIDKSSRRVTENKCDISLTNKEFDLLFFLATNPNKVFTKEELFREIWGYDSMGETSTVTVHINRIREKLHDSGTEPKYIETIWGAGYRFKKN